MYKNSDYEMAEILNDVSDLVFSCKKEYYMVNMGVNPVITIYVGDKQYAAIMSIGNYDISNKPKVEFNGCEVVRVCKSDYIKVYLENK